MTMAVGSVTPSVNTSTGVMTRSGSGMALALFDGLVAAKAAQTPPVPSPMPTLGGTSAPYSVARPVNAADITNSVNARIALYNDMAGTCTGLASMVSYITTNAKARVTNESLGVTPDPNDPNTPIRPPGVLVEIPIV